MKIKHEKGMVTFAKRAGKDMVRSCMPLARTEIILKEGKDVIEDSDTMRIVVDDTYFFPAEKEPRRKKTEEEEVQ